MQIWNRMASARCLNAFCITDCTKQYWDRRAGEERKIVEIRMYYRYKKWDSIHMRKKLSMLDWKLLQAIYFGILDLMLEGAYIPM